MKTQKLVMSALFAAMIYVITAFTKIPTIGGGQGYVHLGDMFIFLAAYYVGGWYAIAAAAIGSGLADATLGYFIFVPGTVVIKGLMAGVAVVICKVLKKKWGMVVAFSAGALTMVVGYFLYELAVFGFGVAIAAVLGNLLQAFVGVALAFPVIVLVNRAWSFEKNKRSNGQENKS